MTPEPSPRLNPVVDVTSRISAAVVGLVAALVLVGWAAEVSVLKGIHPRWTAMNPLTAVCFVLCAVSLWLSRGAGLPRRGLVSAGTAALCAALVAAFAFMKLADVFSDEESRDTLQSVLAAHRLARRQGHPEVVVCSDGYHVPRIRLMLGALGVATRSGPAPAGRYEASPGHTIRMALREAVAIPYDLAIVLARRRAFAEPAS